MDQRFKNKLSGSPARLMPNAPEMAWRLNCVGNMLSTGSAYRGERIEGDKPVSDITLTPRERALIRNEFMVRFGQAPRLESGILVKRWATGPNKGQPKPGTVIQGMLDRGLLELRDDGSHWLRARFTEAGLAALRHMAEDARALPPGEYQHVLDELGSGQRAEVEHG